MNAIPITSHGAVPGTDTLQTDAIQRALDQAAATGGTVVIPAGTFLTGTLDLTGASLHLEKGAVLLGSPDINDYGDIGYHHNEMGRVRSLLHAADCDGIRITGEGTIDLNGDAFYDMKAPNVPQTAVSLTQEQLDECTRPIGRRPNQPMFFLRCRDVRVEGIHILNAPCWTMSFVECEDVRVTGLTIRNSEILPNNDGMHFCGCRQVFVRDCNITAGDDCIALSGITDWNRPCEDVVISDCILTSCSKAIAIGYMHSIVRNVAISNCLIVDSNRALTIMASARTGLVENVLVSNTRLDTRIRAGNWWGNGEPVAIIANWHHLANYRDAAPADRFEVNVRNIRFQNLICTGENAIGIVGEGDNVQGVHFDNISMALKPSRNLPVKGRLIDASPGEQIARLPETGDFWLHVQGAGNVTFDGLDLAPVQGTMPGIHNPLGCRLTVNAL